MFCLASSLLAGGLLACARAGNEMHVPNSTKATVFAGTPDSITLPALCGSRSRSAILAGRPLNDRRRRCEVPEGVGRRHVCPWSEQARGECQSAFGKSDSACSVRSLRGSERLRPNDLVAIICQSSDSRRPRFIRNLLSLLAAIFST